MSIGKNQNTEIFIVALKTAMAKYGLNQPQLAEKIGLPSGGVSAYLNGKTDPGFTKIQKIATGLGLTLSQFFALAEGDNSTEAAKTFEVPENENAKDAIISAQQKTINSQEITIETQMALIKRLEKSM